MRRMKKMRAFMCRNCSEQIRIIGDVMDFKNSDMEEFLNNTQKCCKKSDWVYQYTRKIKEE